MAVRLSCFIELSPKDSVSTVWFTLGIAAQHDRRLPPIGAVAFCQAVAKRMPSSARSASRRRKGGWIGKDPPAVIGGRRTTVVTTACLSSAHGP